MLINIKGFIYKNILIYLLLVICFLCSSSYVSAQLGWRPEFIKADSSVVTPGKGGIRGLVTNTKGDPLNGILLAAINIPENDPSLIPFPGISPVQTILGSVYVAPWILFSEDEAAFNETFSSLYNDSSVYGYGYGYYGGYDEDSTQIKIYQSSTDFEGKFFFQGIDPGKYVVVAYDPTERGYIFSYSMDTTMSYYSYKAEDDDLTIVNADEIAGPLTISLELGGNLTGKVVDENTGEPIEGIPFVIMNQYSVSYPSNISSPLYTLSNSEGQIEFYGLPAGKYDVNLNYFYSGKYINPSSIPGGGYYSPYGFQPNSENMYKVSQGKTTTGCDFALKVGGVISGRIISQTDGKPIGKMSVVARSSNPEYTYTGYSYSYYPYAPYVIEKTALNMEDGTYRIEGLTKGSYILAVNHRPLVTPYADDIIRPNFQPAFYGDTQNIDEAIKVSVTQGEKITNIDFHLKPGSIISGKVFDAVTNTPLAKISIVTSLQSDSYPTLLMPWYSSGYDVITDSNGEFKIVGLIAGDYGLTASDNNSMNYYIYGPQDTDAIYLNACYCPGTQNSRCDECGENNIISIGDAEIIEDINFQLIIGGCIKGRLVNTEGEGISGLMVNVWPGILSATYSSIQTGPSISDNEGNFSICGLSSGSYEISIDVGLGDQDYLESKYDNPDIVDEFGQIKVVESETTECGELVLQRGGSVTGLVTNAKAEPLQHIMVRVERLSESGSYYIPSIETGSDGRFTIKGLATGMYKIIATDLPQNIYLETTYCAPSGENPNEDPCSIKVTAPNETSGITIVMQKGGIISGTVVDAETGLPYQGNMLISASEKLQYPQSYAPYGYDYQQGPIYEPYPVGYGQVGMAAYVDKNGHYELTGFPEGEYIVSITTGETPWGVSSTTGSTGYGGVYSGYEVYPYPYYYPNYPDSLANKNYLPQFYKDAASRENATPIALIPGQEISGIDFHLLQGSSIKGTVRDSETGEPITDSKVIIELVNLEGNMIKIAVANSPVESSPYDPIYYGTYPSFDTINEVGENDETTSYGSYTIATIPRGTYLLKVYATNYFEAYYHVANEASTQLDLTSKNDLENIDIFLDKKGSISGRVIREMDKESLTSILLLLERMDKPFDPFFTGKPLSSADLLYGFCPSSPSPYEAESDSICVNIMSKTKSVMVGDDLLPFSYSDEDGHYTIYGLEPGTYRIFARDLKFIYRDEYYDNTPFDEPQNAIEVQLGRGENLKGIDFSLLVGNTYEGPDLELPEMPNVGEVQYGGGLYGGYGYSSYGSSALSPYGYQSTGTTFINPPMISDNGIPVAIDYATLGPLPSEPYTTDIAPVPTGYQPYPTDIAPMPTEYQPPDPDIIGEPMPPSQPGEPERHDNWGNDGIPQTTGFLQVPKIISEPEKKAFVDDIYSYQIVANSPVGNNDALRYYLEISPSDMSIDNQSGLIIWSPDREDLGSTIVKFKVVAENNDSFNTGYGNMISSQSYQLDIIENIIPPEDVTDFSAIGGDQSVALSWTHSIDSAEDLSDQLLYIKTEDGYGEPIILGKEIDSYEITQLNNNITYTFKLTVIDSRNNESDGAIATATPQKLQPPQTNLIFSDYGSISSMPFLNINNPWDDYILGNNLYNSRIWKEIFGNSPYKFPWENLSSTSLTEPLPYPTISDYFEYNPDKIVFW